MDADGKNLFKLTDNSLSDLHPIWFDPAFTSAVSSAEKLMTTWAWLKNKQ